MCSCSLEQLIGIHEQIMYSELTALRNTLNDPESINRLNNIESINTELYNASKRHFDEKKKMNQRTETRRKPQPNVYAVSVWPAEAQTWMDAAVRLDLESGRGRDNNNTNHCKLNVAHVCTGLAFELAYKSLLVAEFTLPQKTHSIEKLHKMLKAETQRIVEGWVKEAGWKESGHLLEYLDERMAHPDRKYWMDNPWKTARTGVSSGTSFIIATGIMTIPNLAPILYQLANLGAQNLTKARQQLMLIGQIRAAKASDPDTDVSALEAKLDQRVYELYSSTSER